MAHYQGSGREGEKARKLAQQRDEQKKKFEELKKKIHAENQEGLKKMDEVFQAYDARSYEAFRANTVGLQTLEDFRQKRIVLEENERRAQEKKEAAVRALRAKKEAERKKKLAVLSFAVEDDEEDGESSASAASSSSSRKRKPEENGGDGQKGDGKAEGQGQGQAEGEGEGGSNGSGAVRKKRKKDPTADTSFLPDEEREEQARKLRQQLEEEYKKEQERIKQELIEITYSYWDGSGHRRTIKLPKGTRMDQFLERCRKDLAENFHELRGMNAENLMYIKEDLIIPHHYTFYDLIVTKARGKSGPLFHFDVHDDVRLIQDVRIEKDESHAGKIVTRAWYERNKHIFPASRWEVYDPSVKWDRYTIR